MTKAEMAAYLRKERERDRQSLLSEIKSQVQPIAEQRQMEDSKRLVAEWRASHKELSDDVMALVRVKVQEHEALFPDNLPVLTTKEQIEKYLAPFIAQAQLLVRSAKPQATSPTTEVPVKQSRPATKNLAKLDFDQLAEEAARRTGHASLEDAVGKFSKQR